MKPGFFISLVVILLQLDGLRGCNRAKSAKPKGSTGCSKKFPNAWALHGLCWRYCKGSSGNWCYTDDNCKFAEESCTQKEECGGYGCLFGDEGCVTSCPLDDLVPMPTPSGATGCSFRYVFTTYCYRYCEGNTGSWCYTGTGCRNKEETCADNIHCAGIGCSGSEGCVEQCPQVPISCIEFSEIEQEYVYGRRHQSTKLYSLRISRDSREVPNNAVFNTRVKNVASHQHSELRRRGFPFTSLSCWDNFEYIPFNDYLLRRAHEMEAEAENNPDIRSFRPDNGNAPPTHVIQRSIGRGLVNGVERDILRVESISAVIQPRHINAGNRVNFPPWTTEYMRNQLGGRDGDVRFHLVPNELSGPPELYNMIPGHQSVNNNVGVSHDRRNNDWRSVERTMREHLRQDDGNHVVWRVGLYYEDLTSGRPTHIMYVALLYSNNELTFVVQGAVNNEQL